MTEQKTRLYFPFIESSWVCDLTQLPQRYLAYHVRPRVMHAQLIKAVLCALTKTRAMIPWEFMTAHAGLQSGAYERISRSTDERMNPMGRAYKEEQSEEAHLPLLPSSINHRADLWTVKSGQVTVPRVSADAQYNKDVSLMTSLNQRKDGHWPLCASDISFPLTTITHSGDGRRRCRRHQPAR